MNRPYNGITIDLGKCRPNLEGTRGTGGTRWGMYMVGTFSEGAAWLAAPAARAQDAVQRERAAIWGYALGDAHDFAGNQLPLEGYRQQDMTRARGARIC